MKIEFFISIFLIIISMFFEQIDKINIAIFGKSRYPRFENKKLDKIISYLIRTILFFGGIVLFIYALFFQK